MGRKGWKEGSGWEWRGGRLRGKGERKGRRKGRNAGKISRTFVKKGRGKNFSLRFNKEKRQDSERKGTYKHHKSQILENTFFGNK